MINNGVNTTGGVIKDGGGRWTVNGASTYAGPTSISAGTLKVTNGAALGSAAAGTTVFGGAQLELSGGVSLSRAAHFERYRRQHSRGCALQRRRKQHRDWRDNARRRYHGAVGQR